jgi:hypothetical protein
MGRPLDQQPAPNGRINDAIQRGLQACRNSVAPIVTFAQLIDALHLDPTWNDDDVRLVERGLRRVLARVMGRDE